MDRKEIENKINEFLVEEIEIDADKLNPDALLKDNLGIDSLDFVDIVVIVEKTFGIKIKPEDMTGVDTLGKFYDYIEAKLNTKD